MSETFSIQNPLPTTSKSHIVHMAAGAVLLFAVSAYAVYSAFSLPLPLALLIALLVSVFYPAIGNSLHSSKNHNWEKQVREQLAALGFTVPANQSVLKAISTYGDDYNYSSGDMTLVGHDGANVYHVRLRDGRILFNRLQWVRPEDVTANPR